MLVAVQARAVEGAANAAVVEVMAEAFGLRRADVEVVAGPRGRDKIVALAGDERELTDRLARLLEAPQRAGRG